MAFKIHTDDLFISDAPIYNAGEIDSILVDTTDIVDTSILVYDEIADRWVARLPTRTFPNGDEKDPSISFTNNQNSGLFYNADDGSVNMSIDEQTVSSYSNTGVSIENNLNVGGTFMLPTGATNQYYLKTDASGNATWSNLNLVSTEIPDSIGIYSKNTGTIVSNEEILLDSWTVDSVSPNVNFNPTSGIFSPSAGFYSIIFDANQINTQNSSKVCVRIVDDLDQTTFVQTSVINDIYNDIVIAGGLGGPLNASVPLYGSLFFNLTFLFDGVRTYRLYFGSGDFRQYTFMLWIAKIL